MTFQQKLDDARALIERHNSAITNSEDKIDADFFFKNLSKAGGTNAEAASQCTWEDLQGFGLPKLMARQVAAVFRTKEEKPVLKRSKVEAMGLQDLIANYDPRTPASLITERLNAMLSGKRFIVFKQDGTVDVPVSVKLASEILDGYPDRELFVVLDVPTKTYKVGERPDQSFDENPLYPGRVLRPDGDCDQTNRSWSGVSLEVRQTLYLALQTGECAVQTVNDAHNVLDLVIKPEDEALKTVRRRFPKATAKLTELKAQGKAPALKLFKNASSFKKNDPFGGNRTY